MAIDRREAVPATAPPPVVLPAAGEAAGAPVRQSSLWRDAYRRYLRNKGAVMGAVVFILIVLYCLLIPGFWKIPGIWTTIFDIDPNDADFTQTYLSPSLEHPFGTDGFGRDLFTRTALGGQISIAIGFAATLVILVIGVAYGAISGFIGGRLDNAMMRFLDALYGLPFLPFAILTIQIVSNQGAVDRKTMVIALAIASWFTTARIVRGQIISLKQNDYVRAAQAVGARWYRILAPPPAAEHPRHPHHRDVPRAAAGRPRRGVPLASSASASTRPTPHGARWRRRAARPTGTTRC